jgi:hypothetical protein
MTPDIGVLIQYLTVSDSVTWEQFKDSYIRESFRRNARWVQSRYSRFISLIHLISYQYFYRLPADHPHVGPELPDNPLVEYWSEATSVSTKLMLFNVLFLDIVAHPQGKSFDEVKAGYLHLFYFLASLFLSNYHWLRKRYDNSWGRLTEEVIDKLKIGAIQIGQVNTLQEVMTRVGWPNDEESIANLIRWAYANEKEVPVPLYDFYFYFYFYF